MEGSPPFLTPVSFLKKNKGDKKIKKKRWRKEKGEDEDSDPDTEGSVNSGTSKRSKLEEKMWKFGSGEIMVVEASETELEKGESELELGESRKGEFQEIDEEVREGVMEIEKIANRMKSSNGRIKQHLFRENEEDRIVLIDSLMKAQYDQADEILAELEKSVKYVKILLENKELRKKNKMLDKFTQMEGRVRDMGTQPSPKTTPSGEDRAREEGQSRKGKGNRKGENRKQA